MCFFAHNEPATQIWVQERPFHRICHVKTYWQSIKCNRWKVCSNKSTPLFQSNQIFFAMSKSGIWIQNIAYGLQARLQIVAGQELVPVQQPNRWVIEKAYPAPTATGSLLHSMHLWLTFMRQWIYDNGGSKTSSHGIGRSWTRLSDSHPLACGTGPAAPRALCHHAAGPASPAQLPHRPAIGAHPCCDWGKICHSPMKPQGPGRIQAHSWCDGHVLPEAVGIVAS